MERTGSSSPELAVMASLNSVGYGFGGGDIQ